MAEMTTHVFNEDLLFSEDGFPYRSELYTSELGWKNPSFVHFITEEGKRLQRADIDLTAYENGRQIGVSEKIRKRKYGGDVLVEIYSSFEDRKKGWLAESEADYITLFFTNKRLCVDSRQLKQMCKGFFDADTTRQINAEFKDMIESGTPGKKFTIKGVSLYLCVAKNETYHTVSVCFPEWYLRQQKVEIREF